MTEVLIAAFSWLAINVITWASGKLGISKTYVSVWLCLLIWVWLYLGQIAINKYPMAWEHIVAFATGSYWFSQVVWNIWNKINQWKE